MDYHRIALDRKMAGESLTVAMHGGAPWGFRLYGGETDPLVVAKVGATVADIVM